MRTATRIRFAQKTPAQNPVKDAAGNVFDASKHVAPENLTASGTFRLKSGKRHS